MELSRNPVNPSNRKIPFFTKVILAEKMNNWFGVLVFSILSVAVAYVSTLDQKVAVGLLILILGLPVVVLCMANPFYGLQMTLAYTFFAYIFSRYLFQADLHIGVVYDVMLGASLIGVLIKKDKDQPFSLLFHHPMFVWILIGNLYAVLQGFNPLVSSRLAWIELMRRILEDLTLFIVVFGAIDRFEHIKKFIRLLFILAAISGLYACFQEWHGLFNFEIAFIQKIEIETKTQFLFLYHVSRKYSTMADPTSFGMAMAYCIIFFMLLTFHKNIFKRKWWVWGILLMMTLGMSYSGTRTANIMLVCGFVFYFLLNARSRNTWLFATGFFILFLLVLYLPIHRSPTLNRVRTSFIGTKDASYLVREINRSLIQPYIYSHPFGGGVGTTGNWGAIYNPGHPLAAFQTDNGYLATALEIGWIGLILLLIKIFVIFRFTIRGYFAASDSAMKIFYAATICGTFAYCIAHLAQAAIGSFNSLMVFYPSLIILLKLNASGTEPRYQFQPIL